MKNSIIAIALLLFVSTACQLSEDSDSSDITAEHIDKPTTISFDEPTYNFGDIDVNGTLVHSFKFTNTGNSPLVLFDVKASCGCTALKGWPKAPILPGESEEIAIELNPSVASPAVTKTITVTANTSPSRTTLKLKGKVNP